MAAAAEASLLSAWCRCLPQASEDEQRGEGVSEGEREGGDGHKLRPPSFAKLPKIPPNHAASPSPASSSPLAPSTPGSTSNASSFNSNSVGASPPVSPSEAPRSLHLPPSMASCAPAYVPPSAAAEAAAPRAEVAAAASCGSAAPTAAPSRPASLVPSETLAKSGFALLKQGSAPPLLSSAPPLLD